MGRTRLANQIYRRNPTKTLSTYQCQSKAEQKWKCRSLRPLLLTRSLSLSLCLCLCLCLSALWRIDDDYGCDLNDRTLMCLCVSVLTAPRPQYSDRQNQVFHAPLSRLGASSYSYDCLLKFVTLRRLLFVCWHDFCLVLGWFRTLVPSQ